MNRKMVWIIVLLALATSAAYARGLFDNEADFLWELSESGDSVVITGYTGSDTDIWIPPRIQGLPVTGIGDYAFSDGGMGDGFVQASRQFTSVIIPGTVQSIGRGAFHGSLLSAVTIPQSVTYIGWAAFCSNRLRSVTIANAPAHIADWAFCCNRLERLNLGDSITHIGAGAFADSLLESVSIPNSVTFIGDEAFAGNRLESVIIPDSVTFIGDEAFADNLLESVVIGSGVTYIGYGAFAYNHPLRSVSIGGNVEIGRAGLSRYSDLFGTSFADFYESQGRVAGTYTHSGDVWNVEVKHDGTAR